MMAFIKEEMEELKIEEVFSLKQEDTEEQTDLMPLKEESQDPSDMEEEYQYEKPHQFMTGEKYFSNSKIERTSLPNEGTRKIEGHMKVKSGKSPFTCQQCGRSFSHKKTLNRHMKIHTGMKAFTCQQGGKRFSDRRNLDAHMSVHTGERPFTCSQCGKSYTHKKNLNVHMQYHTIILKENLNHSIHTRVNGFICQQCRRSFENRISLKNHVKTLRWREAFHVRSLWKDLGKQSKP
uniref:C2H2-type domain-containing protein n=1 Tax=Cyprinus carpio TaxID=7962 RepID=A0A8C2CX53_CYPCA